MASVVKNDARQLLATDIRALALLKKCEAFAVDGAKLRNMVKGAQVFMFYGDRGQALGAMAIEVQGRVLFCTAAASAGPGGDFLPALNSWGEREARKRGCAALGFATKRPGMVKVMGALGFSRGEGCNFYRVIA